MKRLDQLDGIRGLAIVMVISCHVIIALWPDGRGAFGAGLEWMFASGVDLFFVLSGFLISGILIDARGGKGVLKAFYMRRILRIVPLYYGVLIFYGGLLAFLFPEGHGYGSEWLRHPISHFLFISNFQFFLEGQLPKTPLDASWSLAIEEHFYLLWPSVVLFLSTARYIKVCIGVILTALIVRYVLVFFGANDNQILIFTFSRMDSFAYGGLLAWAFRHQTHWETISKLFFKGMIIGLGFSGIGYPLMKSFDALTNVIQPWLYTFANIGFACLIGYILNNPTWIKGLFLSNWLRSFGRYSYGIYLTNLGVVYGLTLLLGDPSTWLGGFGGVLFVPLGFGASWIVGMALYHSIEKPFLKMKIRYPYKDTKSGENVASVAI